MRARAYVVTSLLAGALASGCSRDAQVRDSVTVRDSAGVTIVENRAPGPAPLRWRVDPAPLVRIGTLAGDPRYQFSSVAQAVRLSDGGVLLVDKQQKNVRVFDAQGRFLRWIGGSGEGPGEFLNVSLLGILPGDTALFYDVRQSRVSRFTSQGGFLGSFRLEGDPKLYPVAGAAVFGDGTLLARTLPRDDPGEEFDNVRQRLPISYHRLDQAGRPLASFGTHPGRDAAAGRELRDGGVIFTYRQDIPFGKVPVASAAGERAYLGSADSFEILVMDTGGRLARIIRLEQEPRPVTQEEKAHLVEEHISRLADPARAPAVREYYRNAHYPEFMPAYRRLMADPTGAVWVQVYRLSWEGPAEWMVFDGEGRLTALVALRPGFRLTDVGEDYVVGVVRDELDVEYVQVHRLRREFHEGLTSLTR